MLLLLTEKPKKFAGICSFILVELCIFAQKQALLNLENIGIEFGGRWLMREVAYQFLPGERIGLIGRNGAGKSTLLRVISGAILPSEGRVNKSGGMKIGYFHQDLLSYETDLSIFEVARQAYKPLLDLQAEIEALLEKMEAGEADEHAFDELAAKQATFETQGGNLMDASVHEILSGLGFSAAEHEQPYETFSGGWRMRVLLAQMLLTQPDILMLDEPTNHLDLPSIQWLENYLRTYSGTVIIVSHDRYFIDRMATKIVEISLGKLHVFGGNYSFYLQEKELRKEQQIAAYENQQRHIAEQEKFINRFKYKASKAKQAQSRIKQLDRLERIEAPEEEAVGFKLRFIMNVRSGKEVLNLRNIHKAYGEKEVIQSGTATVMRGDKIALIGANGLGKSTLLRIIADTEPFSGSREVGHNVNTTFFAQHQLEALNLSNTVLKEVDGIADNKTETELRGILGAFMFSGDEVEKKVQVLSGGEKSRVAMAKVLLSAANFLLLDEPTNHLDIQSIQVLVQALNAFEGTYVVVSHDRFFLQAVANKIWYLEDRQIKEYPGTYQEFETWQKKREQEAKAALAEVARPKKVVPVEEVPKAKKPELSYQEQKQRKNRLRKLLRDQETFEAQIMELEAKQSELELKMASPEVAADFSELSAKQNEWNELAAQLDKATETWEEVLLELEALEGND